MDCTENEMHQEASSSANAPRRRFLASGGQALADSMKKSIAASASKPTDGKLPSIYKVPQRIRQADEGAYEPHIVSIGPYHNGKESLQSMEDHKWRYLDSFLSRNPNHPLEDYLEAIAELDDEAWSCYSENVGPKNELVKMMVLDGCFIVELFLKLKEDEADPIFSTTWMPPLIGFDMLLLENQIPYFVLDLIFKMVRPVHKPFPYSLEDLTLNFFLFFFDEYMPTNKEITTIGSAEHLLDLFHSYLITQWPRWSTRFPRSSPPRYNNTVDSIHNDGNKIFQSPPSPTRFPWSSSPPWSPSPPHNNTVDSIRNNRNKIFQSTPSPTPATIKMIPCAADLKLSGIKLKKKEVWSRILDVKFSKGVLEIPPLSINFYTNTLLRNLVAFEQCYPNATIYFTSYVFFMDCLVNTSKDVELLHRNRIIDHLLGNDDEVARLFNRLCIGITNLKNHYLSDLYKDVEEHCNTEWNMWWASLRRDYFTNPWAGLSSIAAAILLLLSITQTVFAIFPYFRPRSNS